MRYEELITLAEKLINTFNPVILTLDSHCDEFMRENGKQLFDTEQMFLKQVFSGVTRYQDFLKILTRALFTSQPATTNRNDGILYQIFGYLIIFRLDELPYNEFKKMVNCQDPVKMNVFLEFLFDLNKVEKYVKPGWIEIMDQNFIQDNVIGGLEGHIPLIKDLLSAISSKATGKKSDLIATLEMQDEDPTEDKKLVSDGKKPTTKQLPFKLTQAKMKEIPEPIIIPKIVKSNPVPKNQNKINLKQLHEDNSKRKDDKKLVIIQGYKDSQHQPFDFQTDKRPTNLHKVKKQMEDELNQQLQFDKKFAKPAPHDLETADIKLNAAAILREEMLLQKKKEIERIRVQNLEVNMRDSGEFGEWQKEMREKDALAQLEHQQRKKVEMELARESAMRAQEDKYKQNHQLVEQMKEDQIERMKENEDLQREQVEHRRKLIEQVTEAEKNVAVEKEKLVERNKKVAEDSKMEMAKLIERKKLEDEQLRQKREELIKQIRELEKQPRKRTKGYDPTETMGLGLLEEMSFAELRERLQQVATEQKQEEEKRRDQNSLKKDDYLNSLQRKVNDIKQNREEQANLKEMERQQKKLKKQKENDLLQEVREQQLIEVQGKIKDKKTKKQQEEERIAREVKETKLKQQYMNANKAMVEEKAWKSQQDGLEREIKERQNEKLITQEQVESVKYKERQILANTAKTLVQSKVNFNKDYDKTLLKAYENNDKLHMEVKANQARNYKQQKEWDLDHSKNMVERDQFKSKLAKMSLDNSKKAISKRSHSAQKQVTLPPAQYVIHEVEEEHHDKLPT